MILADINPPVVPKYDPWTTRPKVSTAPPGLRNLPPVVVPPKPVAKPKPLTPSQQVGPPQGYNQSKLAPCGSKAAAKRHVRNNEFDDSGRLECDVCQAAREERATRNPIKKRNQEGRRAA